ncbi:MAG: hypothetical protein ACO1OB_29540 [Archangium sp.]
MTIRDITAARRGLGLIAAGFAAEVLSTAVSSFLGLQQVSFAIPIAWLVASALMATGLAQLALTDTRPELTWLAAALVVLRALLDFGSLALLRSSNVELVSSPVISWVSNGIVLLAVAERSAVAWLLFRAANQNVWASPFAVLTVAAELLRAAYTLALAWGVTGSEGIVWRLLSAASISSAFFGLSIALFARATVTPVDGSLVPPREQGLQASSEPMRASVTSDLLVGAGVLLLGIAVTTISASTASSGGRYIVATGAIVFGVVRIVRSLRNPHR